MCDNAMTYNRPDTVYYKLAKKILHAGFKMMSKVRGPLGESSTEASVLLLLVVYATRTLTVNGMLPSICHSHVWAPLL